MIEITLSMIWTKLVKIEKMLELARLQRIVDNDYNSMGHVMLGTIEEIRKSGFAAEFGYEEYVPPKSIYSDLRDDTPDV